MQIELIKNKKYIISFALLYILTAAILWIQVDYFTEEGVYPQYTLSVIEDQDLNIINQIQNEKFKWLVSETKYHPDFEHSGITIFTTPFYYVEYFFRKFIQNNATPGNISYYFPPHIIFTITYITLGLILLSKVAKEMIPNSDVRYIYLFLLSTPFTWYTFFQSTSTNSFGFFYSSMVLYFFTFNKSPHKKKIFLLGLLFGFGLVIRIQLAWTGILFLYMIIQNHKSTLLKTSLFLAGSIIPLSLLQVNQVARGSSGSYALLNYFDLSIGTVFKNSLIGENGYLILAPALAVCFLIYLAIVFDKKASLLLKMIGIPPLALFIFYNFTWALMDGYIGRHQQSFLPIYSLFFLYFMANIEKYTKIKRAVISLFIILFFWNIICNFWYISIDSSKDYLWKFIYPFNTDYFRDGLALYIEQRSFSSFYHHFLSLIPHIPLLGIISYLLIKINHTQPRNSSIYRVVILYMITSYSLITASNYFIGKKNVIRLEQQGYFDNVVIGNNESIFIFDDYIQVLNDSIRYYMMKNDCTKVINLKKVKQRYIYKMPDYILEDRRNFKESLTAGTYKSSISYYDLNDRELNLNCPE
ncbi:glycosyltransferase family 39 protein [Halobacteriovorax marinus]|uniref:glycosyltransferase family 39 protein n=1 Tax=Halobacteriovorax marinus TaxID=97084 RepID=UPI003A8EC8E2